MFMPLPTLLRTIFSLRLLCFLSFLTFIVVASAANASVTYTYDNQHRLISVVYEDGTSVQYTYDATGNRLTSSSSTSTTSQE